MSETQDKRFDGTDKAEAENQETPNPFFDEVSRDQKTDSRTKSQDDSKPSNTDANLPNFEITNESENTKNTSGDANSRDVNKTEKSQNKAASDKFGPGSVLEAFETAKQLNIPVIVNRNMDACAPSQQSNKAVDSYFKGNAAAEKAPAVLIDLNLNKLDKMRQEHANLPDGPQKDRMGEELKLADQLMNAGNGQFPKISRYDAKDSSTPQETITGANRQSMDRLIHEDKLSDKDNDKSSDKGNDNDKAGESAEQAPDKNANQKAEKVLKFSDKDIASAKEYAEQHKLPLIVFTGGDFCAPSQAAAVKLDKLANNVANEAEPKAVIVKLDLSKAQTEQNSTAAEKNGRSNESLQLASELTSKISQIPHVGVYNPGNMKSIGTLNLNADTATQLKQVSNAKEAMDKRP